MADYYPLIARAIAGLDPSAPGESRRALYERARSALIAQLRSVQPSLSESEITRERLSLEEAVRKVEAEAAARARPQAQQRPQQRPQQRGRDPLTELARLIGSTDPFALGNRSPEPETGPEALEDLPVNARKYAFLSYSSKDK